MKALTITRFRKKGIDNVQLADVPVPQPKQGQVLVRMKAAAFNPADLHIAHGAMALLSPVKPPMAMGMDGAGIVEAVGVGVREFQKGDEICFYTGLVWCASFAEYAVVDASSCAPKPAQWSFAQAASASLALLCADLALERGGVGKGQRILVHAGGGSVGAAAIFLAAQRGAVVETTGSQRDLGFVRNLGAEVMHDYRETPLSRLPRSRYDIVLEGMGDQMFLDSVPLIKKGGSIVSLKIVTGLEDLKRIGMQPPGFFKFLLPLITGKFTRTAKKAGVRVVGVATYQDGKRLASLTQFAANQGYTPRIDRTYELSQALIALKHFADGKPRGKVVVEM
ncbi:NADP-dependent oxidoreductase [Ralstonia pseudosolanacearum]|uniref:NADP-dependent oxidoreductase n=1 Tax=Ralstonia solanacearum species complex TaxID=3116862 RepID=UPI0002D2F05B|nr:NADP-dependent oxidoreductase [Ralstonia pseudosolanacearum]MCK4125817.1 NADP-dependent oxidoreductase [Ralstonia pseudosolanacearum]QKL60335.1 NADP-dependent oxidoreductase [Ralstonia solanacearum]QKL65130.1 NADP-dependent oxidoreductase [Ralstonia solanacearum]QKM41375.1 NADP-dependent oxidoreductase [Ralstonia solanacearum]